MTLNGVRERERELQLVFGEREREKETEMKPRFSEGREERRKREVRGLKKMNI